MQRTAEYFGKKMCNLFQMNVLEWENERLFKEDPLNKIVSRKIACTITTKLGQKSNLVF